MEEKKVEVLEWSKEIVPKTTEEVIYNNKEEKVYTQLELLIRIANELKEIKGTLD